VDERIDDGLGAANIQFQHSTDELQEKIILYREYYMIHPLEKKTVEVE
jgi:hypothetical protein